MKVYGDNLPAALKRGLSSIYLISGEETLLVGEASDAIRGAAQAQGYQREKQFIERGFDWQALRCDSRTASLFAERRLIELAIQGSPGEEGADVLVELAANPIPDTMILAVTGKLDARAQQSRWVRAIEQSGVWVPVGSVERARLPAWIRQRFAAHGLEADDAAATVLADRVEGNLLAAHQEIAKLTLLLPPGPVTAEDVLAAVADSARYDVLQLGEAAMSGQCARALRILANLQGAGVEPTLILWALNKDLQWIARVQHARGAGTPIDQALNAMQVWRPRHTAMKQALGRLQPAAVRQLLVAAARIDRIVKGVLDQDVWLEFQALIARFAGVVAMPLGRVG
jgi:DNA polymerase-3 subunit delta